MLLLSLAAMVLAIGLEVLFAWRGYFRVWPLETLPLVLFSFGAAVAAWRRRGGKLRALWLTLAFLLMSFYGWASFVVPRLPSPTAQPTEIAFVGQDLTGQPLAFPAAMQRAHALIVLFRGAW